MNKNYIFLGFYLAVIFLPIMKGQMGNVGINTSSPSATLDIVSKEKNSTSKVLEINNSFNTEMMTILNNGRIGIENSTPELKLHIKNNVDGEGVLELDNKSDGGFAGLYFTQGNLVNYRGHIGYVNTGGTSIFGGKGTFQIVSGNRPLVFSTNSNSELFNEVARFDNTTGNLGIGTTTPKSKLEVNGLIATGIQNISSTSLVSKSYVSFSGGTAILPRAQDNPGAMIFIRNINNSGSLSVTVNTGGGLIFSASTTTGLSSVNMNASSSFLSAETKTILFISDGANWTALSFSN